MKAIRGFVRLMAIGMLAAAFALLGAVTAEASPSVPGVPDCKDPPPAQSAGFGFAGVLDPKPNPLPAQADPFTGKASVYDQYGYAGLRWSTYDLGCGGSVRDPAATADTMGGNALLGLAVTTTALANGIHNKVAHPESYMEPLDKVVDKVTGRIHQSIWSPWGGVALLGVAALLLMYSLRGQLSSATSAAAWALLVLTVLAGVVQYPSRVSTFFDDAVTSTIGQTQASAAGVVTGGGGSRAQGALTVDRVLYEGWLRGQLGSSDSATANRWGPSLYKASTLSWHELEQTRGPEARKQLLNDKSEEWTKTAEQIEDNDPAAYQALQGKAGGRTSAGFMALMGVVFTTVFRLIADLFLLVGLVLLRLLVMFLPAAAVVGVIAPLSPILRRMANLGGAALINVVAFSVASTVHTVAIVAVLDSAKGVGMTAMALVLCAVLTLAAFILTWPLLSFRLAYGSGSRRPSLRRAGRQLAGYVLTREAVEKGVEDADKGGPEDADKDGKDSKSIPSDRPNSRAKSRSSDKVDPESERIYRSLGIRDQDSAFLGEASEATDAEHRARQFQPYERKADRPSGSGSDEPVLVGTVVSSTVGPRVREDADSPPSPTEANRQPRVRIYEPASKRTQDPGEGGAL